MGCVLEALYHPGYLVTGGLGPVTLSRDNSACWTRSQNLLRGDSHMNPRGSWNWRPDPQSQPPPYPSFPS